MDLREKFSLAFLYFLSLVLIFLHEKKRNEKKRKYFHLPTLVEGC